MTVSRNLYPSLYLEIEDKSTRSACHKSSIPVVKVTRFLKFLRTGLCRVYVSCLSIQSCICFLVNFLSRCLRKLSIPPKLAGCFGSEIAVHVTRITFRTLFSFSLYSDVLV